MRFTLFFVSRSGQRNFEFYFVFMFLFLVSNGSLTDRIFCASVTMIWSIFHKRIIRKLWYFLQMVMIKTAQNLQTDSLVYWFDPPNLLWHLYLNLELTCSLSPICHNQTQKNWIDLWNFTMGDYDSISGRPSTYTKCINKMVP